MEENIKLTQNQTQGSFEPTDIIQQKDEVISLLKSQNEELSQTISSLNESLAESLYHYKEAIYKAHPEIFPELISGDNIDEINLSVERGKDLIQSIKGRIYETVHNPSIELNDQTESDNFKSFTPLEKIKYAIIKKNGK